MSRSHRSDFEVLPRREELDALARYYHHLQREHQEASPGSSVRRRVEERLLSVRERIDRLLEEWVPDDELRRQWRAFLDHHAPEPEGPPAIQPLVFRGVSDVTGSTLEVRGKGDEYEVWIDGSLSERIVADKDFSASATPLSWRYEDLDYQEIFSASPEALDALTAFVHHDGPPPWELATELLSDGLVDAHFALTPRGRRAVGR